MRELGVMTDAQITTAVSGTAHPDDARAGGPDTGPGAGDKIPDWRQTLPRREILTPLILVGVFLVLWVLVLARPTFLTSFDVWARDRVQGTAHATDGRHRWPLIKDIADLGGGITVHGVPFQVQLPVATMAVVALAAAAIRRAWRPLAALAAGYGALLIVLFLKAIGDRPGPSMAGQAMSGGLGYFPSGHTANTMLCYGTSALILAFVFTTRWIRVAITTAMTLFALAVGFSLVWMDFHWVSDVLGSYALCGAALFGVARILGFRIGAEPNG
jgi:undecaprenyl-diphosphatase